MDRFQSTVGDGNGISAAASSTPVAAAARRLGMVAAHIACASSQPGSLLLPQPCAGRSYSRAEEAPTRRLPLAGKVAIITGAGRGIGEAAAKLLASQGASVVVADLDADAASAVATAIEAKEGAGRAIAVAGDVTDPNVPARIVAAAIHDLPTSNGCIDILINNAGFTWDGVIHKMSEKQWDTMLQVHCTAPFRLIKAAEPHMRGAGKKEAESGQEPSVRHIINISSTSGTHGNAGQVNYATAKAGVVGMTKAVAKEFGPFGVRCNAIAFGLIDTRLTQSKGAHNAIQVGGQKVLLGIPDADGFWAQIKSQCPLRRSGTVDEAAGAIMMLVSPWASYITGQVLEVNGGAFM